MIILKTEATEEEINLVVKEIKRYGLRTDVSRGQYRTVIDLIGDEGKIPFDHFATLPGVKEVIKVGIPYKLISREYAKLFGQSGSYTRAIQVGDVRIGDNEAIFIAGPCAVESKKQLFETAEGAKKAGAHILRGGVFKPRSSVYSFQGLGAVSKKAAEEALRWLSEAGKEFGLPVVTEIRGEAYIDLIAEYADILQIGSRNMYDQDLLTKVAKKKKPVLLKRHFGAGIEEFLSFAEYIAAEGNKNIILCERGIVPVGKGREYTRYTLDLAAVAAIRKETYLPIIVDPSHGTGRSDLIFNISCAAIAAGAHGLMIEVHHDPAKALVDGRQAITPDRLNDIIESCCQLRKIIPWEMS